MFYECEESKIASYTDDTNPKFLWKEHPNRNFWIKISSKLFQWFQYNHLKANPGKCILILSFKTPTVVSIGDASIKTSTKETLLEILINSELSFDQHISSICSTDSKKLHALGRIATFMSFNKRRTLLKAFIESQFNCCPLLWMFYSRTMNNKINRIHERALRSIYSDNVSSFDELLKKDRSFAITTGTFKVQLLNFTHFFTVFLQVSWKMSSIFTQIFHTTLGHAVNFIVEIQKQWNTELKLFLT